MRSLVQQAEGYYRAAMDAQRAGDWAGYGEQIRLLGRTLSDMREADQRRRQRATQTTRAGQPLASTCARPQPVSMLSTPPRWIAPAAAWRVGARLATLPVTPRCGARILTRLLMTTGRSYMLRIIPATAVLAACVARRARGARAESRTRPLPRPRRRRRFCTVLASGMGALEHDRAQRRSGAGTRAGQRRSEHRRVGLGGVAGLSEFEIRPELPVLDHRALRPPGAPGLRR